MSEKALTKQEKLSSVNKSLLEKHQFCSVCGMGMKLAHFERYSYDTRTGEKFTTEAWALRCVGGRQAHDEIDV